MTTDPFKPEVHYEWVIEYTDSYGDVIDLHYADKNLTEFTEYDFEDRVVDGDLLKPALALCRNAGNEGDGLQERGYAHTDGATLPEHFCCGHKVPQRFKDQLLKLRGHNDHN